MSTKRWRPPRLVHEDDLNPHGALSRSVQPGFLSMITEIAKADRVTIIIGAGFSMDAGLPSWQRLIDGLIDGVKSSTKIDFQAMVRRDTDDPMRKAEHVIGMRLSPQGVGTTEDLVRNALYSQGASYAPGPLLRTAAELVSHLSGRVSILTTNFDELLEKSLRDAGLRPKTFLLDSHKTWHDEEAAERAKGRVPVFHLHGRVRRSDSEKRDFVVLSESHFLRHGPLVRKVVAEALECSVTVFLGLSMTDPNLVGPLWDTRNKRRPSFVITVPERVNGYTNEQSRLYGWSKSTYLHKELHVAPIFLKTYSQIEQVLQEITLGIADLDRYQLPPVDVNSTAYGARLQRVLEHVYTKVGSSTDSPPTGNASERLRIALADQLTDGELGIKLDSLRKNRLVKQKLHEMEVEYKAAAREPEFFGLHLWLRTRATSLGESEFAVQLVGCSDLALNLPTQSRRWSVENDSENMAARSVARSRTEIWRTLPETSMSGLWHGVMALPIRVTHEVATASGPRRIRMIVGSLCLMTTHNIKVQREDLANESKISVISALNASQVLDLAKNMHSIARDLLV